MADKILRWDEFQEYHVANKNYIDTADGKAIKKIHFDDASRTIKFFKDENADTGTAGDFSVIIPDDVDTTDLIEKLQGAVDGNIIVANADGSVRDGGVALTDLATKAEVTELSNTKIGNLDDLTTTEKASIVGAINEIDGQVAALQAGTYDDSELRNMIGTLTGLSTNAKDNLVNAINEVDAELGGKADKATDLAGYGITDAYTKGETDAKIAQEVANASSLKREIKTVLPDVGDANEHTIYMVEKADAAGDQNYDEYLLINGAFEKIGDSKVDLVDYALKTEVATAKSEAIDEAKQYADGLAVNYDSAGSANAAEVNAKAHADGLNTAMDTRVTALEGKFTFATSDDINGLF